MIEAYKLLEQLRSLEKKESGADRG